MRVRILTALLGISTVGLLAASPALATDLMSPVEDLPIVTPSGGLVGYVEVNVGGSIGAGDHYYDSDMWTSEWNEVDVGASGRVAMPVSDTLVLQLDAGGVVYRGQGRECDENGNYCDDWSDYDGSGGGLAAHLAFQMDGGSLGGMVSFGGGSSSYGNHEFNGWVTGALEAVQDMDNIRLYGQVGVSKAVSGDDADNDELDIFAQGVFAYYIDPNLVVSVNVGADHWTGAYGDESVNELTWGARVEKRLDGTPLSLYVAYQGWAWSGSGNDGPDYGWDESEHAILAGLRFAFGDDGSSTLKDLNSAVGLVDMNPIYGDLPH